MPVRKASKLSGCWGDKLKWFSVLTWFDLITILVLGFLFYIENIGFFGVAILSLVFGFIRGWLQDKFTNEE